MSRRVVAIVEAKPKPRDPIIHELVAAIGAGKIEIGPIHDDTYYVDGFCRDDGSIRINPARGVVDTCLHELTHRMRPKWGERTVRSKVGKLMRQLSDAEVDRIYNVILSTAKVKKRADTL